MQKLRYQTEPEEHVWKSKENHSKCSSINWNILRRIGCKEDMLTIDTYLFNAALLNQRTDSMSIFKHLRKKVKSFFLSSLTNPLLDFQCRSEIDLLPSEITRPNGRINVTR